MQAAQPRPVEYDRDTFFEKGDVALQAAPLHPQDKIEGVLGHFDESALPRPSGASQMEGFNPTTGVAIKMFLDRSFGAIYSVVIILTIRQHELSVLKTRDSSVHPNTTEAT